MGWSCLTCQCSYNAIQLHKSVDNTKDDVAEKLYDAAFSMTSAMVCQRLQAVCKLENAKLKIEMTYLYSPDTFCQVVHCSNDSLLLCLGRPQLDKLGLTCLQR